MKSNQINTTVQQNQNLASNPEYSIWVNANAGTGKTKILVDRFLRILLSGVKHSEILCITYTKAAAYEIRQRILDQLSLWTHIKDEDLISELTKLGIENITDELIHSAKLLCNNILDSDVTFKILTIHGFCTNLLKTFAIEAGVPINFQVLEDNNPQRLEIENEVYNEVLQELLSNNTIILNTIFKCFKENSLEFFITKILLQYSLKINQISILYPNIHDLKKVIYKHFNLDPNFNVSFEEYLLMNCDNKSFNYDGFLALSNKLQENYTFLSKKEQQILQKLNHYLENTPEERYKSFNDWYDIFYTTKHTLRKQIFNKKTITLLANTFNEELVAQEINRLQKIKNYEYASYNFEIFKLAILTIKIYEEKKTNLNFLNYDDILYKTFILLKKESFIPWLFYNLNLKISHILIDEAQDTSPLQWEILKIIAKEIFSNTEKNKSIFIVGDIKQSIFSFQGANPEIMNEVKEYMKSLVIGTANQWKEIFINTSFRSSEAVLDLVNKVCKEIFANSSTIKCSNFYHECFHKHLTGLVHIAPIIYTPEQNQPPKENHLISKSEHNQHNILLAEAVYIKIEELIKEGYQYKDIMILAATRKNNCTLNHLIKLLEKNNIPNSGIDQFILLDNLAIRDLLAIAKFLLQPLNDLNLAILLKTPIFNFNDNDLCNIILQSSEQSHSKVNSLWHSLKLLNDKKSKNCVNQLIEWQNLLTQNLSLYELLNTIIHKNNLYNIYTEHFGPEIVEFFNQCINEVIYFENHNTITSLEKLIYHLENINTTINKEIDGNINEIRFLTIHKAKGLEAKVVLLLDNISSSNKNVILKTNCKDLPILFKLNTNNYHSPLINSYIDNENLLLQEENKRLLYVAITRAKERLYVFTSAKNCDSNNTRFYEYLQHY